MNQHLVSLLLLSAAFVADARADSWIFRTSTYSHDPASGARIAQYAPKEPAYMPVDPTYRRSGYRHIRTTFRGPHGTADRLHQVETWGAGEMIRPYGEWQYPYRAGATPFGPWGNAGGPWTLPFDSWVNPYGSWNQYPYRGGYGGGGYGGGGYGRGGRGRGYPQAVPFGRHGGSRGKGPHGQAPGGHPGSGHGAPTHP